MICSDRPPLAFGVPLSNQSEGFSVQPDFASFLVGSLTPSRRADVSRLRSCIGLSVVHIDTCSHRRFLDFDFFFDSSDGSLKNNWESWHPPAVRCRVYPVCTDEKQLLSNAPRSLCDEVAREMGNYGQAAARLPDTVSQLVTVRGRQPRTLLLLLPQ